MVLFDPKIPAIIFIPRFVQTMWMVYRIIKLSQIFDVSSARVALTPTPGYDHVDLEACKKRGVSPSDPQGGAGHG